MAPFWHRVSSDSPPQSLWLFTHRRGS